MSQDSTGGGVPGVPGHRAGGHADGAAAADRPRRGGRRRAGRPHREPPGPGPEPVTGDAAAADPAAVRGAGDGPHRGAAPRRDPRRGARSRDPIELAVLDAQGLLCAEEVVSQRALPAFDQAALDGYAARADDVAGATARGARSSSRSSGRASPAPATPSSIGPGLALKVAAGAMLPAGADVVVPAVWTDQGTVRVVVHAGPPAGSYVRRTGDDVAPGDPAVQVGTPIGPAQISLLAAVGRERVLGAARGRGSPSCAPAPSSSTSAPRRRRARSSTSTATRSPRPPGTPAPRPTARASCRRTGAA